MERARRFAGRVTTFGIDVDADVRATSVVHRGRRGDGSAGVRGRTGGAPADAAAWDSAICRTCSRRSRSGLHFDVPLDDMVARAAHAGAGLSPRRSAAAARRRHADRRLVQLEPCGARPGARDDGGRDRERAEGGSARRDARTRASSPSRCTARPGGAAAAAGLDLLIAVGGSVAAAMAGGGGARGHARALRLARARRRSRRPTWRSRQVRAGDLVLVKGSRGIGTDLVVERLKGEFA